MDVAERIEAYLASQPEPKQAELRELDRRIRALAPDAELWFLDGTDDTGRVVTNPNIGYGRRTTTLAGGRTRDFYRIGLTANTGGISVYVMGLPDREHLRSTFGATIGKATVTGYCIRFRRLADVDLEVLEAAIRAGL
ncbi:DUF1801 domain-containing protein [Protaetiibacter intestinalis]|uniref:DUF1801 domain-containing protein n=1 Tax=Protaetiibacter intestinalis TaxID=2419774 RepID=A0A387B763_9MICO|nr:DUF1801 domain-containing protein [Protaetiibacter intestinalis]AYF97611.1 DUF1801 domain-containing protein [Protaetiibacter intestinalis]